MSYFTLPAGSLLVARRGELVPPVSPCFARKEDLCPAVPPWWSCSRNCATRLTGRNHCPIIFALPIPVTPADRPTSSVYLRYLPVEVSDESVRTASDAFGNVFLSVPQLLKNFQVSVMVPAFC